MKIETTCKFCRCQVAFEIEPEGEEFYRAKLLGSAACNRCADFEEDIRPPTSAIRSLAFALECQSNQRPNEEHVDAIRNRLTVQTKIFAKRVCDFHRKVFTWEPDFVNQIMEQPGKVSLILRWYRNAMTK